MSISKIALAIPLTLGIACSTTHSQSNDHTGAMWTERIPSDGSMAGDPPPRGAEANVATAASGSQDGLAVQPASGTDGAALAANDPQGSSGSPGASGSSGSMGSSDSSGSSGSTGGGAMGSGGSSETMGSGSPSGSQDQGSGSSDQAQQGSAGMPGNTGAHAGDQMIRGKLSKVSKDEISITGKGGQAKTLKINPDTVVSINGKDAKPTQLKQGQMVRASYENVSGDDVAVKIEVGKARHGRHMKHQGGSSGMGGSMNGGSGGSPSDSSGSH